MNSIFIYVFIALFLGFKKRKDVFHIPKINVEPTEWINMNGDFV